MRIVVFVVLCCNVVRLWGQSDDSIFPDFQGTDLFDRIVATYTPAEVLTYGQARDTMFSIIDSSNDSLTCVYSGHTIYLSPDADPTQAAFMDGSSDGINTEHTYPQSLGAGSGHARSDMHHLFPTRTAVNSSRGAKPFAEIDDSMADVWHYLNRTEESIPPQTTRDLYSEGSVDRFEPPESHKGDVARAIFYFYTIYRDQADTDFFTVQLDDLCQWHITDPADEREQKRSAMIATYQDGKINPFVSDCTLATRLYCPEQSCALTTVDEVSIADLNIYPNPTLANIRIDVEDRFSGSTIAIYDVLGSRVYHQDVPQQSTYMDADVSHLPAGTYVVKILGDLSSSISTVLIKR